MVILFVLLVQSILAYQNWTAKMERKAITTRSVVRLNRTTGACTPVRPNFMNACKWYCKYFNYYNPALPYRNARLYNETTRQCYPELECQKSPRVIRDKVTKKCLDIFYRVEVPPVNASQSPQYKQWKQYLFVCLHGKMVIDKFDQKTCVCDFIYESSYHIQNKNQVALCDRLIPIYTLLPPSNLLQYNVWHDILFPYGNQAYYFVLALIYAVRKCKFYIVDFFSPHELQISIVMLPVEDTISIKDYQYVSWTCIVVLFILAITILQRTRSKQ